MPDSNPKDSHWRGDKKFVLNSREDSLSDECTNNILIDSKEDNENTDN